MAQTALKTCEICVSSAGTNYCTTCEQIFCDNCKAMHNRQKISKDHKFKDSVSVVQGIKTTTSKCKEHKEDTIFVCNDCYVSVCSKCITGKHNGHKLSDIDESVSGLSKVTRTEIRSILDAAASNVTVVEKSLKKFDSEVQASVKGIEEHGSKLKKMIEREVDEMVVSTKKKANSERERLRKILTDVKTVLEKASVLEHKQNELQKTKNDSSTLLSKLFILTGEIEKLQTIHFVTGPTSSYTPGVTTNKHLTQLLGKHDFRQVYRIYFEMPIMVKTKTKHKVFKRCGFIVDHH
ncbi:transcription intermediary factor 1-beta-like [Mytilus trossulus]|uniref:transcription intermediary factor 1-beta-like n=1 Tax=Mytilus trossulus TaxID=6551 RepID=UPI0030059AA3